MGVGNLLKTKAKVWIAPYGEALPDETSVAYGGSWGGNWSSWGYTQAPLKFKPELKRFLHKIEEALGAVKAQNMESMCEFETVLAEMTADNIAYALGVDPDDATNGVTTTAAGVGQKAFEQISMGNVVQVENWAIGFEGLSVDSAGNNQPLRVFITKAVIEINGELEFSDKSDNALGIPVKVLALQDEANSFKHFSWQRMTANAS